MSTLRLRDWGSFHATRYGAGQIRATVEDDHEIAVDFDGVQAITLTFADELVANLVAVGIRLRLSGANEDVFETVNGALSRRDLTEGWEWVG